MNLFSDDIQEFVQCFEDHKVEYLLVGGIAVILYGYERVTGDVDIWVNRTSENFSKIEKAFHQFGMPLFGMTLDRFLNTENEVFRFGRRPNAIDIMVHVKGLHFKDCFLLRKRFKDNSLEMNLIHINHLREAKLHSNRFKDLDDLENLPFG
jgi:hypothetical protein